MSLDQLRYFVTVADAGTLREAARRLHVSQPPLTRQIRALEDELGVELFERSARGMALLPAGRLFLDHTRTILTALETAVTAARASPGAAPHATTQARGRASTAATLDRDDPGDQGARLRAPEGSTRRAEA